MCTWECVLNVFLGMCSQDVFLGCVPESHHYPSRQNRELPRLSSSPCCLSSIGTPTNSGEQADGAIPSNDIRSKISEKVSQNRPNKNAYDSLRRRLGAVHLLCHMTKVGAGSVMPNYDKGFLVMTNGGVCHDQL